MRAGGRESDVGCGNLDAANDPFLSSYLRSSSSSFTGLSASVISTSRWCPIHFLQRYDIRKLQSVLLLLYTSSFMCVLLPKKAKRRHGGQRDIDGTKMKQLHIVPQSNYELPVNIMVFRIVLSVGLR